MLGCWHLLVLLTVILCSSNQPAGENFTVLTPRLVSKLLGTTKHVMLLINCNTTTHHGMAWVYILPISFANARDFVEEFAFRGNFSPEKLFVL